jgi:hypothetical protein
MRVKWDAPRRRWVFAWNGIPEAEAAAKHGYRPLPRPVTSPPPPPDHSVNSDIWRNRSAYARALRDRKAAATWAAKRKVREAVAKRAASLERARVRRKHYFAAWYAINRGNVAARRKAQREAARV